MAEHTPAPWTLSGGFIMGRRADGSHVTVADVIGIPGRADVDADIRLIAAAPQLLDSLLAVEWAGSKQDAHGDEVECCPNCGAPHGGFHYQHCELRDSLDAALGVPSERIVHPARATREAVHG